MRDRQSEQAAVTMAELWGEQVGRFERTAPGFQGAVLLREGAKLLAVSCWEGEGTAEAALDAAAFRARYRLP